CNIDVEDKKWEKELRRLRYCALSYLHDTIDDKSELLKAISLLYDTLNYPEDMVSFIDYMPPTKTDESLSPHDNLLKNFNDFIEKGRELHKKKVKRIVRNTLYSTGSFIIKKTYFEECQYKVR